MTQYAIVTDLDRCVGCLACSVACKVVNGVPTGSFWNKTLRIGPNPKEGGSGQWPGHPGHLGLRPAGAVPPPEPSGGAVHR